MSGEGRGKLLELLLNKYKAEHGNDTTTTSETREESLKSPQTESHEDKPIATASSDESSISVRQERSSLCDKIPQLMTNMSLDSRVEQEVKEKADVSEAGSSEIYGTKGRPLKMVCNYLHIITDVSKTIHQYEVRFNPHVDSLEMRNKYLLEYRNQLGGVLTFDGIILYLPIKLKQQLTTFVLVDRINSNEIEIRVLYKAVKPIKDCLHLYNLLFNRVMRALKYVQFQKRHFFPKASITIPHQQMEIWPGFVTSVDEYKGGLMLCCDISHKLLSQRTVYDVLKETVANHPRNFAEKSARMLIGSVIITRYNNLMYRIDNILFDKSPMSTFVSNDDGEISYMEYYRRHYNIVIRDPGQPLLLHIRKQRMSNSDTIVEVPLCLVPELSFLTGLNDVMRSDYRLMRDIVNCTHMPVTQRMQCLNKFHKSINECPEASKILQDWGLSLSDSYQTLNGRVLDKESIIYASGTKEISGTGVNFVKDLLNNEILNGIHLYEWLLLHTPRDLRVAKIFIENIQRAATQLGLKVERPKVICLPYDHALEYINALTANVHKGTQIVVCIQPNAREDIYAAIKTFCCTELPVPSQVINSKTLLNEAKAKSIVLKILLQMNCKLGGSLWSLNIPFKNTMVCGIDVYHNTKMQHNSVAAFVASVNRHYSKWFSKEVIQKKNMEIMESLCSCLISALIAYRKENDTYPESIVIYRDGISNGQLHMCKKFELPQLEEACRKLPNCNVKITYIVVQKRISTRLFSLMDDNLENVPPGTVVDKCITRKQMYDFYLVPQDPCQGTANAVHYIVLHDDNKYKADIIQRLSYKLCFLYYNWPGAIRVPACCQYAHKLAYLVGLSIKKNVAEDLSLKLYYL